DGSRHPSPNAGQVEAAFAGALGIRLGGTNSYGGEVESRARLGEGREPEPADLRRAVRLSRWVGLAAVAIAATAAPTTRRFLGVVATPECSGVARVQTGSRSCRG